MLRHDRLATHVFKVQDHLKHVPKYCLLPRGMQVVNTNKRRKKREVKDRTNAAGMRRTDNDPKEEEQQRNNCDRFAAFVDPQVLQNFL